MESKNFRVYGHAWCTGCWFRSSRSNKKRYTFFDCLWANFIFELIVCIEKVNGWKL